MEPDAGLRTFEIGLQATENDCDSGVHQRRDNAAMQTRHPICDAPFEIKGLGDLGSGGRGRGCDELSL